MTSASILTRAFWSFHPESSLRAEMSGESDHAEGISSIARNTIAVRMFLSHTRILAAARRTPEHCGRQNDSLG
jgi:hypothetical protein